MIDQEKIIKALDCCLDIVRSGRWASGCITCPYAVEENSCREKMILDVIALLKEQEPKTGHWIESAGDDKCSVCGATYSDLCPDYRHTHYCPNCGAKMTIQAVKQK